MAVNAVTIVPREGFSSGPQRGTVTRFAFRGTATDDATIYDSAASQVIVIEMIWLQVNTGGTYAITIGDDTTGTVVRVEGSDTNVGQFYSDRFFYVGGGSATDSENDIKIEADGAGVAHYIISGYRYTDS